MPNTQQGKPQTSTKDSSAQKPQQGSQQANQRPQQGQGSASSQQPVNRDKYGSQS